MVSGRVARATLRPDFRTSPHDQRVAGVISERPGVILGEGGDDQVKVAHSGRVKVKVDAAYGSIAAGDLLVTSATPGFAMRSEPVKVGDVQMHRPGTLIGKALEPLADISRHSHRQRLTQPPLRPIQKPLLGTA